jgi:hypothetical protein
MNSKQVLTVHKLYFSDKISRTVLIYQRGNQNPYTEEEQKLQWQKAEGEKR